MNVSKHLPMLLVTLFMAGPLIWMVGASLKSSDEYQADPMSLWPESPRWENYQEATTVLPFWQGLTNTLLLCAGVLPELCFLAL